MLAMTLMYSSLAIIIFICRALFWENKKQLLASLVLLLLEMLVVFTLVYFLLPSRNLLSLLLGNAVWGGIFLMLTSISGKVTADQQVKKWVATTLPAWLRSVS